MQRAVVVGAKPVCYLQMSVCVDIFGDAKYDGDDPPSLKDFAELYSLLCGIVFDTILKINNQVVVYLDRFKLSSQ